MPLHHCQEHGRRRNLQRRTDKKPAETDTIATSLQVARRPPWWHTETGSVSAEVAVAVPALMALIVLAVQFALWQHASAVTKAAAEEGVRAVRVEGAAAADGEAEARGFLTQAGPSIVVAPEVAARRTLDEARVEVTATAISLVPWLHLPVHAVAASPVERYRPPRIGP